ncbi:MAG: electron transport complex subunit RsxC, partial [Gammaproteobacteria bacterium]|nr:electron transport complex subunit RsxC [Gammaproteobacteria bacterium]
PSKLLPQQLYWYAGSHDHERLERFNIFDCIECGCCDYVCPSNIRLAQHFRYAKAEITVRDADRERAQLAKHRFENRDKRQTLDANERAEQLAEKKRQAAAALDIHKRRQVIDEVMERVKAKERASRNQDSTDTR